MAEFRQQVLGWNVRNIFINEYHNIIGELFRFTTSWQSLCYVTSLNVKIMLLSATADRELMKYTADFMSLAEFDVIGSTATYKVPNISINVVSDKHHIVL
jgi:hypothetical protein